jgi:GcrA cell cycle regulator
MNWTEKRVEELRALLAQGQTGSQIAKIFGVTRNAVMGKIDRLRIRGERKLRPRRVRIWETQGVSRAEWYRRRKAVTLPSVPSLLSSSSLALVSGSHSPQKRASGHRTKTARPVLIIGLTLQTCRWPLFDGREPESEKFYCGEMPVDGLPYCHEHCRKAYNAWPSAEPMAASTPVIRRSRR